MSKETMTNEAMEMVTENEDVVIEAAEAIVEGNDIDLWAFGKKVGVVLGVACVIVAGVKYGVPFVKKLMNKDKSEVIDCAAVDYEDSVSEAEVGVEDEE